MLTDFENATDDAGSEDYLSDGEWLDVFYDLCVKISRERSEVMDTNYKMLRDFKGFKPKRFGILDADEVREIRRHFRIGGRSNIGLQNLRDFVVLYYSKSKPEDMDIMSGIVGVIDEEKIKRGMEV